MTRFHPRRFFSLFRGPGRPGPRRRSLPKGPGVETLEGRALLTANGAFAAQLTHSAEYFTNLIDADYQKFLSRLPTSTEVTYYLNELNNGQSDANLLAGFAGSAEFYKASGGTDAAWVNAMYQAILGRTPTSDEVSYYVNSLASGNTRNNVSLGFATSPEHEAQVITYDYGKYLDRAPSSAELSFYVNEYASGISNENIIAGFVGSTEFAAIQSANGTSASVNAYNFVDAAYKTILNRAATPSELSAGVNQLIPAPASQIPASGVYSVSVKGTINGSTAFAQAGTLVVAPTVTTTGSVINTRDIGLDVGNPGLTGPTGSLGFASNLKLFGLVGSVSASPLVLASVAANTTTGKATVVLGNQAVNTSQVYQNIFDVGSTFYLMTGGTISLQFSNAGKSVTGTISLKGSPFGSSVATTYVATFSGTLT